MTSQWQLFIERRENSPLQLFFIKRGSLSQESISSYQTTSKAIESNQQMRSPKMLRLLAILPVILYYVSCSPIPQTCTLVHVPRHSLHDSSCILEALTETQSSLRALRLRSVRHYDIVCMCKLDVPPDPLTSSCIQLRFLYRISVML